MDDQGTAQSAAGPKPVNVGSPLHTRGSRLMPQKVSNKSPSRPFRQWLGNRILKAVGWTLEGDRPNARRYVLIAAPHSTNWDLFFMLALAWAAGIELS